MQSSRGSPGSATGYPNPGLVQDRNYSATNQFNIENQTQTFNQYHTYQTLDSQRLVYTVLEGKHDSQDSLLQQLAGAMDVRLTDGTDMIPFVSPKEFEDWKDSDKLLLHGINGIGKSRCVLEILRPIISEIEKIYVVNPDNILRETQSDEVVKTVSDLVNSIKPNDVIIWCNFPDGLEDGQNPQRGREALVKVSSTLLKMKGLFLTLNPAYRELYRGIASRTPEIQEIEVDYTQDKIKQLLQIYGMQISKYKGVYQNYIENGVDQISQILFERERTPATVSKYFDDALETSSKGFLNPVLLARQFKPPKEFYRGLFRFIKEKRPQESHFLFALKLCYDLRLPRTRVNVKTLQEKIFNSPIPQSPEESLSSWVYATSGQYSISDQARNEITYPDDIKGDIVKYLGSDEFLNSIPKDASVYGALGTFLGTHLGYLGLERFSSVLPDNIINFMNTELSFKNGLAYGLTLGFSTFDMGVQEKIWRLSEDDKTVGVTLFSGLGKFFHILSPEIQNRILQRVEESSEIEAWFAYGLGFSFSNLPAELQDQMWNKAQEKLVFGNRLAWGVTINYPTLNRQTQEKLWQMIKLNTDFSYLLGLAIGTNIAYFDPPIQEELEDKIKNEGNMLLECGFTLGRAASLPSLGPDLQDRVFEELETDEPTAAFVALGLGIAIMNSNQAVQDKIWSKVEEDDDIMELFAASIGGALSFFNPSLQEKIWEKAEANQDFASSLAAGLGNIIQGLNPSLQEKIWEKAEKNQDFGAMLAIGLGRLFPFHNQKTQQKIWEKVESSESFGAGVATGLGEWNFQSLNDEYKNKVWTKAEQDTEFGGSFVDSMAPNLLAYPDDTRDYILQKIDNSDLKYILAASFGRTFGYMDEINRGRMLEMGNENPKMNFIVAFGIGLAFSMYDNELQRQMVERIEIDEDLEFYRNFADGFAFGFDADSESREKLSQLVNDDTKASSILGFGVGRNYSEIQLDTIKEVSVLVGQSEHFAYNMGRGASMVIEDFDKKIKKQLLQTAKDYPAFAKGLGQINHS